MRNTIYPADRIDMMRQLGLYRGERVVIWVELEGRVVGLESFLGPAKVAEEVSFGSRPSRVLDNEVPFLTQSQAVTGIAHGGKLIYDNAWVRQFYRKAEGQMLDVTEFCRVWDASFGLVGDPYSWLNS